MRLLWTSYMDGPFLSDGAAGAAQHRPPPPARHVHLLRLRNDHVQTGE